MGARTGAGLSGLLCSAPMRMWVQVVWAVAALGCATITDEAAVAYTDEAPVAYDHHNARNALDWSGAYEGSLPGLGPTRLVLEADESYVLEQEGVVRGRFRWLPDGNTIELDDAAGRQRIFVSENYLLWLPPDGRRPTGERARQVELRKVSEGR